MKWIPDSTGRFGWRPYYDQEELDYECERLVMSFLNSRYGESRFPISTDDLTVMIEQDSSELDLYADLSIEGEDVEGVTEFFPRKKPAVKIAVELSLDNSKNHRLRTTLAHEYGHVRFHGFLWNLEPRKQPALQVLSHIGAQRRKVEQMRKRFDSQRGSYDNVHEPAPANTRTRELAFLCRQDRIVDAPFSDWMEWQAGYISGAILMPLSQLRRITGYDAGAIESLKRLSSGSDSAKKLIASVSTAFDVSTDAAKVRLEKLGFLQNTQSSSSVTKRLSTVPIL